MHESRPKKPPSSPRHLRPTPGHRRKATQQATLTGNQPPTPTPTTQPMLAARRPHPRNSTKIRPTTLTSAQTLYHDKPGTCRIADGPALDPDTARRLCCNAGIVPMVVNGPYEVLNLGRTSRFPNTAQRRALHRRDMGRCRFPGCRARRGVEAHHIAWWSLGGPTDLDNLILLCGYHHMLVHEGGYSISILVRRPSRSIVPMAAGSPARGSARQTTRRFPSTRR